MVSFKVNIRYIRETRATRAMLKRVFIFVVVGLVKCFSKILLTKLAFTLCNWG